MPRQRLPRQSTDAASAEAEDSLATPIRQHAREFNKDLFGGAGGASGLIEDLQSLLERAAGDLRNAAAGPA